MKKAIIKKFILSLLTIILYLTTFKLVNLKLGYKLAFIASWGILNTCIFLIIENKKEGFPKILKNYTDFLFNRIISLLISLVVIFIFIHFGIISTKLLSILIIPIFLLLNLLSKKILHFEKFNNDVLIKNVFAYSLLFLVIFITIFSYFIVNDASFMWRLDALWQHYPIMCEYNEYVRSLFNNFSSFTWNMGLGEDIIGQYSYYIIGDPFAYISFLFPMEKLELAFNLIIVTRMYFVGIAFLVYCYLKKFDPKSSLLASLCYTFSAYLLFSGIRHPYFINPMIILPFLILGIDYLFDKNKMWLLTGVLFFAAIANYYFFYMLTWVILLYSLCKYIFEYKDKSVKNFFILVIKGAACYFVAILLSGIVLYPTLYAFFNSFRTMGGVVYQNSVYNYRYTLLGLITTDHYFWSIYGISSIVLISLPLMIRDYKSNKKMLAFLISLFIFLMVPILSSIVDGFSFPNNRWGYAITFIFAVSIAKYIKPSLSLTKGKLKVVALFICIYFMLVTLFESSMNICFARALSLALIMIYILTYKNKINNLIKNKINLSYILIFVFVCLTFVNMGNYLYTYKGTRYAEEFDYYGQAQTKYNTLDGTIPDFDKAIEYIKNKDNSFYRIGNPKTYINTNIIFNYKSTAMYLSIGSKYECGFAHDLENPDLGVSHCMKNMDSRTKANTTLGVKYYILSENDNKIPFGYKLIHKIKSNSELPATLVYENKNYLSPITFYDKYIPLSEYNNLNALEKENSLVKEVAIDKKSVKDLNITKSDSKNNEIDKKNYKLIDDYNILNNDSISTRTDPTTGERLNTVKLKINKTLNSELYVYIDNLRFEPYDFESLKVATNSNYSKFSELNFKNNYYLYPPTKGYTISAEYNGNLYTETTDDKDISPYYYSNKSIVINLGYKKVHNGFITLTFSELGNYKFDSIKLYSVKMDDYVNNVKNVNKSKFIVKKIDEKGIIGNINVKNDGILRLATSYSKGWKVYVDNEEKELINVNGYFAGVGLKKGNHEIKFEYNTPYLKIGVISSILGLVILIMIYRKEMVKNEKD